MDDKPTILKQRFARRSALKARLRAYYKFLARQPVERFVTSFGNGSPSQAGMPSSPGGETSNLPTSRRTVPASLSNKWSGTRICK